MESRLVTMEAMDIPQVLAQICPDKFWGPNAQTGCSYEDFARCWPEASGPVPSQKEMEKVWKEIYRIPKSKDEITKDLNKWLRQDNSNLEKLVCAIVEDKLLLDPKFLEKRGIPVSGEKKPD